MLSVLDFDSEKTPTPMANGQLQGMVNTVTQQVVNFGRQSTQRYTFSSASCHVCQNSSVEASLMPCGHRCFCYVCATRLCQMPKPVCPICQGAITGAVRFSSSLSSNIVPAVHGL
ncbi:unnamed protein product [Soboliphyme baturini]|uniref:RING-type domain-containing protein n=1 Tax=Soboliphyme baturini TaxID=241478 RepID=A0A183I906_9BILA|nr:unnamed protein product [Soboliphyme baturini]